MIEKYLTQDINKINEEISQIENILKESMMFHEDDEINEPEMDEEPEMDMGGEIGMDDEMEPEIAEQGAVDSYIEHIRKYSINALSKLCDNPEGEEYQMLKKIFQMCDKKPEKKDGINESHRLFGILKENKKVIFEVFVENAKDFSKLKNTLISESKLKGFKPSEVRLVSENKIII